MFINHLAWERKSMVLDACVYGGNCGGARAYVPALFKEELAKLLLILNDC